MLPFLSDDFRHRKSGSRRGLFFLQNEKVESVAVSQTSSANCLAWAAAQTTSHPSTSCFLSKNRHWWDRADRTVWPLTFVGTCHAASNPWHYSVRPRYRRQLWLLPLNMSLSGVGAAAAPPAETSLRRCLLSALRGENATDFSPFPLSLDSVWAEDASRSRRRDRSARWKQVRHTSCLSLRGEAAGCVYKTVTWRPIRALYFYSYWQIIVNPRANGSAVALVFVFLL